jgi:hypothetical protein
MSIIVSVRESNALFVDIIMLGLELNEKKDTDKKKGKSQAKLKPV